MEAPRESFLLPEKSPVSPLPSFNAPPTYGFVPYHTSSGQSAVAHRATCSTVKAKHHCRSVIARGTSWKCRSVQANLNGTYCYRSRHNVDVLLRLGRTSRHFARYVLAHRETFVPPPPSCMAHLARQNWFAPNVTSHQATGSSINPKGYSISHDMLLKGWDGT